MVWRVGRRARAGCGDAAGLGALHRLDDIQLVLVDALRSLGDQVVVRADSIVACLIVTGATGWWLVASGGGPLSLVWASGAGMVVAALLHGARVVRLARCGLARRKPAPCGRGG